MKADNKYDVNEGALGTRLLESQYSYFSNPMLDSAIFWNRSVPLLH